MGLRPLEIVHFLQCGDRFYTPESDVYRRQILAYKDSPRVERVRQRKRENKTFRQLATMVRDTKKMSGDKHKLIAKSSVISEHFLDRINVAYNSIKYCLL